MARYPYDRVIFNPGHRCRTCDFLKPARTPLAMAFLLYHTYLIWAGMTTNESAKWSDWKEDVADGLVFKSTRSEIYGNQSHSDEDTPAQRTWPVSSDQILVITDGEPPKEGFQLCSRSNEILQKDDPQAPVDTRWTEVNSMREIDNIYDLGFWDNLREVFHMPIRRCVR
ncbi:palmitoyltransferase swf1 [Aspergillus fumigatus]